MSEGRQPSQLHKLFGDQLLHSPEKESLDPINLILGNKNKNQWFLSKTGRRELTI